MKVSDFSENDEMVWKEIKDLTAWKAGPRPGPGRRVGVAARPAAPHAETQRLSAETEELALHPTRRCKGRREGKTIFKKHKAGRLARPDFKTYHKATVIKTVWHKYRPRDNEKPETHLHICSRGGTQETKRTGKGHLLPHMAREHDIHRRNHKAGPLPDPVCKNYLAVDDRINARAKAQSSQRTTQDQALVTQEQSGSDTVRRTRKPPSPGPWRRQTDPRPRGGPTAPQRQCADRDGEQTSQLA